MKIINLTVSSLKAYEKNARVHSQKQIKQLSKSIKNFGFNNPILIDETNQVIAGHGRLEAAKSLGLEKVPCIYLSHLSKEQARAYVLADNQIALNSEWNDELLESELNSIYKSDDSLIDLLGFDDDLLESVIDIFDSPKIENSVSDVFGDSDEEVFEKSTGEEIPENTNMDTEEEIEKKDKIANEIPEIEENKHNVKLGDIYKLGEHKIMCGDSTDENNHKILFENKRANFCFTSPPYSDQRDYRGEIDLSVEKIVKFLSAPCDLFAVNLGMQRKNFEIVQYWNEYIDYSKKIGHKFLSWNIWDKGVAGSVSSQTAMFAINHEWILVFGKKRDLNLTVPNKSFGEKSIRKIRKKSGIIVEEIDRVVKEYSRLKTIYRQGVERGRDIGHPARFPVGFAVGYIEACSDTNDIIFEPFLGSGSTLIACEETKRKCYGVEIDPHYCSISIERWEKFTGRKAEKIIEV